MSVLKHVRTGKTPLYLFKSIFKFFKDLFSSYFMYVGVLPPCVYTLLAEVKRDIK